MTPMPPSRTSASAEQAWNEQALAQPVVAPAWRLWCYTQPAVVLGTSQRRLLPQLAGSASLPIVLRSAGGGAVLAGPWMIGISAVLPPSHPLVGGGAVDSYRWLGEALACVLYRLGATDAIALAPAAVPAARARLAAQGLEWACFGGLSPWEVVAAGGRKLAGLAQVRRRQGVLLVGGVLLAPPPWELLCAALGQPPAGARELERVTVDLGGLVAGPAAGANPVAAAIGAALDDALRPA